MPVPRSNQQLFRQGLLEYVPKRAGTPLGRKLLLCHLLQVVFNWVELTASAARQEGVQKRSVPRKLCVKVPGWKCEPKEEEMSVS